MKLTKRNRDDVAILVYVALLFFFAFFMGLNFIGNQEFQITTEICKEDIISKGETTQNLESWNKASLCKIYHTFPTIYCDNFEGKTWINLISAYEKWDCTEDSIWFKDGIKYERETPQVTCERNVSLDKFEIMDNNSSNPSVIINYSSLGEVFLRYRYSEMILERGCEMVEVDELKMYEECLYEANGSLINCGGGMLVLKEDLTIELLKENCNCIFGKWDECPHRPYNKKVKSSGHECGKYYVVALNE